MSEVTGAIIDTFVEETCNHRSGTQSLTVDTVAPAVIITGGANALTNDPTPTIRGTAADPGATVSVSVSGVATATTVQGDGTWSVTAATLSDGLHPVAVTIADAA